MTIYLYSFISVLVVSLISLIGVFFISLREDKIKLWINGFLGLATGALIGDAFFHLFPESFEASSHAPLFAIIGIVVFLFLEIGLRWHHHHGIEHDTDHEVHPVGPLVLFADGLHNFIDGAIITAGFLISPEIGIATTLAVILHEIPQEIGDFALLLHSGFKKSKALLFNFLSALTALLGIVFVAFLDTQFAGIEPLMAAIAGGGFVYIALADIIPHWHANNHNHSPAESRRKIWSQIIFFVIGLAIMYGFLFLE